MVLKIVLTIAAVAILITLGVSVGTHRQGQSAAGGQGSNSLVELARRQKALGEKKATVPEVRSDYAGYNMELEHALKNYSVFIAEPIQSKSFPLGLRSIHTLTKFRILETLSRNSYWYCSTCSPLAEIPQEMGKPNQVEFFVATNGGVLNVEGVEVIEQNNSLFFEMENKYLMFVNLAPSQVGVLAGGPSGVFRLDQNDNLHPLGRGNTQLPSEVRKRFGLKLSEFKSYINR